MNPGSPGIAYRLLSIPLYLFWVLHALKHGFKHGVKAYLRLRMCTSQTDSLNRVWVHASSVGEVRAVAPLVHALLRQGEPILFTSFTITGYQAIQQNFAGRVACDIIPFDQYWHCRHFFNNHHIKLGLVMETELWPELLYQARRKGIELVLINARLSRKSVDSGKFVRKLLTTTLGYFSKILTRNEHDRKALINMGAVEGQIEIIGNLKSYSENTALPTRLIERDYLVLASSHAGEEEQFLATMPDRLNHYLLVIAPRHPDRSTSIQALMNRNGISFSVRSKAQAVEASTQVYLADTLGELKSFMAFARVVVMGGSFDSTGGHNLIEPASLGCAIITGPSDSNIAEDILMLGQDEGVLQVEDMQACWAAIEKLSDHPEQAEKLGREARSRLAQQPDIIAGYLTAISPLYKPSAHQ